MRQDLNELFDEIKASIAYLAGAGRRGFDCSDESANIVRRWGEEIIFPDPAPDNSLGDIEKDIADCRLCRLSEKRKEIVFGSGHSDARLMFVGDWPDSYDDETGKPFSGPAGGLFSKIIKAMDLRPGLIYVCHIVKCRPPAGRKAMPDETEICLPFLKRQIRVVNPDIICVMGRNATGALLKKNIPFPGLRGRFHNFMGIKIMPTYHPAYLMENPGKKRETWEDVKKIIREQKR